MVDGGPLMMLPKLMLPIGGAAARAHATFQMHFAQKKQCCSKMLFGA
jgi:hypothetical protein